MLFRTFAVDITLGVVGRDLQHATYMKHHLSVLVVTVSTALLGACSSAPIHPVVRPAGEMQGELIVFREAAFAAGAVGLAVGTSGKAFASIGNSEKVRVALPVGKHEVFVQARTAEPTRVQVDVGRGGVVCLRTSSSPSTYAKVVVPIALMVTGYHFYLDEVPCPATEELGKYKDVAVIYE